MLRQIVLVLAGAALAAGQKLDGFDAFANQELRDWKCDGFAIAIVQDGKVILSKGYGLRDVKKNLPKVTVWMDTDRGVSLKQVFDEGPGQYRVSVYFNIRLNTSLPGDAFTFKTDSKTQYINR